MPSKHISPSANTFNPLFNYPHALKTYLMQCQHLKPPLQLPPCPQNILHTMPTPQTPFSTAPMHSKHISPNANTSNPLFNCPLALQTYFTQCQHLKPLFLTAPMPTKCISPTSANTSNPLSNCPHALKTHVTQYQHLQPPFRLPPCRQSIFHTVPTPQTPFTTAPMPSKHISPNANTSNPRSNCPHALKTHSTGCQHLKPPFQLPPCPQNTFHPVPTPKGPPFQLPPCPQNIFHPVPTPPAPFSTAPMPSKHISPSANTSNLPFQLPPCPRDIFHPVPTPQTPFSTAPMPTKRISPTSANTSNTLFNCPHALKTHFTRCQHLEPPFQLPPCPQTTFHTVPRPQTPFSTPPMPSKHISHSANTSNPLFNWPHALKTHFIQCQHLNSPFQLTPCPQNIFYTVTTPQTLFSTAPMPSKHISPNANTSSPLFNCSHALKIYFTQCQHLKPPLHLPPCPHNTFHPVPTPQTPFSTSPIPSKHISPSANTSNPLFNRPHALKTYFTQCQHLKPPFQLPPCPQNIFQPMPTPRTPSLTTPMPSKHMSPSANTSNPRFNCPHALKTHLTHQCQQLENPLFNYPHALKTYFTHCQHLKPPFQLPPCPQNTFHPVPTPQTPFSTAPMPSKHISHSANTSNFLPNCPHALETYSTQSQHLEPPFQTPPCPQNAFNPLVPTPQTTFYTPLMPSKHISPSANTSNPLFNCPYALRAYITQCQHLKPPFQLPPCPQNTFDTVPTPQTPFQLTPRPQNIFHTVPTAQTSFPTAPMPSEHISPNANTSNSLFNSPQALKTYFTQCQHLKFPFQQTPCPQNILHPLPTPQTPFSTDPMPSKHISPTANTSNPRFKCPHALKTQFNQCQHLQPPF